MDVPVIDRLTSALAGHYAIERELGSGGMATVYLAQDVKHARKVAVKVLHPELAMALGSDRFLAEIRVTANLQHPHILPLLDSGEVDDFYYYVMPYVTGESLRERLVRTGALRRVAVINLDSHGDALDECRRPAEDAMPNVAGKDDACLLTSGGRRARDFRHGSDSARTQQS
ncbi:MAG: protein kinase [Gemmatimonadaceae bacterium]